MTYDEKRRLARKLHETFLSASKTYTLMIPSFLDRPFDELSDESAATYCLMVETVRTGAAAAVTVNRKPGTCRECRWWVQRVHSALADQTAQKPGECHGIPTFPITRADDWCSLWKRKEHEPE